MQNHLTGDQRVLADLMSALSEEAWCAGWMQGLEYALWHALSGGPRRYGRVTLSDERLGELRRLAQRCSGWIVFDDDTELTWVSASAWQSRFRAWVEE